MEVNLSLKDINKKAEDRVQNKNTHLSIKTEEVQVLERVLEEERQKLVEHYKNKRYWSKL